MYGAIIQALADRIGADRILSGTEAAGRPISPTGDKMAATPVVRPRSTEELAAAMEVCNRLGVCVIPLGGATGFAGGLKQTCSEIYVSLELMNQIEKIDPVNRVAIVQAGVVLQNLQDAAADDGLSFPVDLGARGSATIGGMIATNAGGEKAFRFGMMREQVLGLEVVTASGQIVDLSNTMIKNNTGYDLKQLFIGSEGTLGIVTRAQLRLRPHLPNVSTAFARVADFASAVETRNRIERALGNDLTAYEVMWPEFYEITTKNRTGRLPLERGPGFYLLFESEAGTARNAEEFETAMAALFEEGLVEDMVVAASVADRRAMWDIRNDISALVAEMSPVLAFDVSLPVSGMEAFAQGLEEKLGKTWPQARLVRFGHLGDNNLHIGVTVGSDTALLKSAICDLVYCAVLALGGAVSAEHGIGTEKLAWMASGKSTGELAIMFAVRQMLDPLGILNPNKVLSVSPQTATS